MTSTYYCTEQQITDWHYRTVCRYQLAAIPATTLELTNFLNNIANGIKSNKFPNLQTLKRPVFTLEAPTYRYCNIEKHPFAKVITRLPADQVMTTYYSNHVKFWGQINKITLHITSGKLLSNIELYSSFYIAFCCFGNQGPQVIRSKQAVAEFNILKGAVLGARSSLQKQKKLFFLYKWAFIVAGLPCDNRRSWSRECVQSLGVHNVFVFPELDKYNYYLFEPIGGFDLAFSPYLAKATQYQRGIQNQSPVVGYYNH